MSATLQLLGESSPNIFVAAQGTLSKAAATKAEAVLLALLAANQEKLTAKERKRRMEVCINGLDPQSSELGINVRELVHPAILAEAMTTVIG